MAASVLRGHRLGHPGVVGWPSRWIGLALPASIAYTALGGIRLIDPAGWIGPPSLVTGGPPAPGVWWWMILAPIFLGEPRLCTQKMVVRARTWRGLHQPGVGCHPAVCARSLLVCLQLWVLTLLGPPMALRQILFGFILSSPVSFETTRSFGRSSPPLRLSNPESPERPLGIR